MRAHAYVRVVWAGCLCVGGGVGGSHLFQNFPQFIVIHTVKGISMEFSRQESWSGLAFPSPGDLPNPGNEPKSFISLRKHHYEQS